MSYIGREPQIGNFQVCDAISVVNGQAAYTMQVGGANVSPETANHMIVSLNGIIQAPGTSYTVSGSTITFASNLATGDVINFIHILGSVLDLGVPSDATVTNAKLASDVISGETDIGGAIADADLFLMDDGAGGTLRKTAASRIKTYVGSGLAEADQWRLTSDFASDAIITANLERTDTYGFGQLGTGMTESSGVFTFPSTGFYLIMYQGRILSNNYGNATLTIMVTTNNSDYNNAGMATQGNDGTGDDGTATGIYIVDVTSTTNVKVKFRTNSFGSGTTLRGNTDRSDTCFTFIKLGDT